MTHPILCPPSWKDRIPSAYELACEQRHIVKLRRRIASLAYDHRILSEERVKRNHFVQSASTLHQPWQGHLLGAHEVVRREIQTHSFNISCRALEHQRLTEEVTKRIDLLSAWTRITIQMMETFFTLVLEDHLREPSKEGMNQLTNLRLVCKHWDRFAVSIPRLWSTATLSRPFTPLNCSRAAKWLARSHSVPKTVIIQCSDAICPCGPLNQLHCILGTEPLAELLRVGNGPFRSLSIACEKPLCFVNLQQLVQGTPRRCQLGTFFLSPKPWDTVTTLKLNLCKTWNHCNNTGPFGGKVLSLSPLLEALPQCVESLYLFTPVPDGLGGGHPSSSYKLDLPSTLPGCLTCFSYCGILNAFIVDDFLTFCHDIRLQVLPHLRSLRLDLGSVDDTEYLERIIAPRLQILRLSFIRPMSEVSYPGDSVLVAYPDTCTKRLMNFIDDSRCQSTLTHLQLERVDLKRLYDLLNRLTSLTNLVLIPMDEGEGISGTANWLFEILLKYHEQDTDNPPLPALRSLSLLNVPETFYLDYLKRWRRERRTKGMVELKRLVTEKGTGCVIPDGHEDIENMEMRVLGGGGK